MWEWRNEADHKPANQYACVHSFFALSCGCEQLSQSSDFLTMDCNLELLSEMNPISSKLLLSGFYFTMATERKLGLWLFAFPISIKENTEAEGCSTHLPGVNRDIEWTSPVERQVFQWVATQYPSLSHCPFRVNTSFLIKRPKLEVILNKYDPEVPQWPRETETAPQATAAAPGRALRMKSPFPPCTKRMLRISLNNWFWKFVRQNPKNLARL